MKKQPVKNTHGGAGRGQGKKPIPVEQKKVTKAITVSVEFAAWMPTLTEFQQVARVRLFKCGSFL